MGKYVNIQYVRGALKGTVSRDNVMVGGIILKGQDFIEGNEADGFFKLRSEV